MKKILIFTAILFLAGTGTALEIIEAKFGADTRWADATEGFKKLKINDDFYFGWIDGNKMAGKDPAPGVAKQLIVKYKDNSIQERSFGERSLGGIAAGAPEATEGFTLGRAFWGAENKFTEVTERVRSIVSSGKQIVLNGDTLNCGDPIPGKEKLLVVFYSYRGKQYCENFRERSNFKGSMIDGGFDPIPLAKEVKSPFAGMELDKAVWQWSIPMAGTKNPENNLPSQVFLYIPENTATLRGVVVGMYNMLERPIMEHPKFREYMQKLGYGCIWIAPAPFGSEFNFRDPVQSKAFETMFQDLAKVSGYKELSDIPFIGLGHSAMANFPYQLAAWKPERAIAGISYDGSAPGVDWHSKFGSDKILDEDALKRIAGIPFLQRSFGVGGAPNKRALVARNIQPELIITVISDPGSGHFDINDDIIDYMGKYLLKARGKVSFASGRLIDFWRYNTPPAADFKEGNWVFDEEHAKFHEAHEALYRGKKVQLLGYIQNGKLLPDLKTHFQIRPAFLPEKDGLTFHLTGTFLDTVTEGRAPGWSHKKAGEAIEHGTDPENIEIYPSCGPVVRLGHDKLALRFDRFGFTSSRRTGSFSLNAIHPGDDVYRRSVLQSEMIVPVFNTRGTRQYITFPEIPNVKAGTASVKLAAVCNTGFPVEYLVVHGPAYLRDGELIFTPIPPKAKYPVEVKITAWQYGNNAGIQSAEPVTRTFRIVK